MTEFTTFPSTETTQLIEQLIALYQHEVDNREAERRQVVAYLNDTAVQTLSALHIHFSLLHTAPEAQIRRDLANALPIIVDLMADLTNLARQLRPLELDTIGLDEALKLLAEEFTGPPAIHYEGNSVPALPPDVTTAFYQLAQEFLQVRQNQPEAAPVAMRLRVEGTAVHLTMQELLSDGLPPHPPGEPAGLPAPGLLGLMVRFQQLKGRVTLHTPPSQGATVTAVWPWLDEASQYSPGRNPVQHKPG